MAMKVVRPSESELSCSARTNIKCPVKDCKKVLPQPPALRLHMVKVHKIVENCKDDHLLHRTKASAETGVTVCYKCPVSECIFNGPRHFTMWKSLKQHYMKIHAEKKFCCETCDFKFGLRADLKRHLTTNHGHKGKDALNMPHMLTCSTQQRVCERDAVTQGQTGAELGTTTYPSTSSTTSCVRVKPPGQGQGAPLLPKPNIVVMAGRERQGMQGQLIFIADACPPRQTLPLLAPQPGLAGIAQRQKDANTQTLVMFDERETGRDWQPVSRGRRRNHSSTQTLAVKRRRNVAQTQTTGDFILRRAMRSANIPIRKASTGCQMSPVTEPSDWCNKSTKNGPTQTLVPRAVTRQWKTNLVDASTAGCLASLSQPMVMSVDAACSTWDVSPGGSTWDLPLPETMSTLTSNQLDTETQTMVLLEELQASLAESISTQTFESFLETTATTSSCQDERPQNSAQTQTRHSVLSLEPCFAPTDQSLCQSPITAYASDPLFGGCSTDDLDLSGKYMSQSNLVSTRGQQGTPLLTENFDFLNTQSQTGDLDPDYMHMETQTSIEDIFDQLLSNMETQTSDDVFGDMEFTDIYTQTTLKPEPSSSFDSSSTETQTSLHTLVQSTNMAEFSNTETQTLFTGIDFGTTLANSHTQTTWNDLESVI